jgi:hypothetical protein
MKGTIERLWQNESKKGQPYLTVQIAGERYNVWDSECFERLKEGDQIEYRLQESGNFRHLTDIRPAGAQKGPQPGGDDGDGNPRPANDRDTQIRRMSCLKSASEILGAYPIDVDVKAERTVDLARRFERYVTGEDLADFPFPGGAAREPGQDG